MKELKNLLKLIIITFLLSCGQTADQNEKPDSSTAGIQSIGNTGQLTEEKQKQLNEHDNIDSLRLEKALKDAFQIAQSAFKQENFTEKYDFHPDDSSYTIKIEIEIGKMFNDNQKYFLLRRHIPWATNLVLYKIHEEQAEKLITREQGGMTYIRDTIVDVNDDGYKDFLVHWYPSSGCCRRDVYNVYLNLPDQENFTQDYQFVNPTFSVKEKLIRGVEYGHPGEVGLYKYKWTGLQIDTIEFIYHNANNKQQFIKTKKRAYRPTEKDGIVLEDVPEEYQEIESYEWFAEF